MYEYIWKSKQYLLIDMLINRILYLLGGYRCSTNEYKLLNKSFWKFLLERIAIRNVTAWQDVQIAAPAIQFTVYAIHLTGYEAKNCTIMVPIRHRLRTMTIHLWNGFQYWSLRGSVYNRRQLKANGTRTSLATWVPLLETIKPLSLHCHHAEQGTLSKCSIAATGVFIVILENA